MTNKKLCLCTHMYTEKMKNGDMVTAKSERPRLPLLFCEHNRITRGKRKMLEHLKSHETCTRGHSPNRPQPEPGTPSKHHLGRVLIFAIVSAAHDGLLLPHPGLSLVGIGKVLLGLQRVLQVLPPLGGLGLQRLPLLVQLMELGLHVLGSKMACRAGRGRTVRNMGTNKVL